LSGSTRLFAYGTLQIPAVWAAVVGEQVPSRPARLMGYARRRIKGCAYPGIREMAGASVEGLLYDCLPAWALEKLDAFEDDYYRRETLSVQISRTKLLPAEVYVIPAQHYGALSDQPWNLEEFRETHLRSFLRSCAS
jgi:gamma-glutamylcyclotransferase (GGCT)/AIG2-like uncharacterized protein YtfP